MICPYCNNEAQLVSGEVVYPHRPDLYDKHFWVCVPCDARVGCHDGTTKPLGRLANAELRQAKMAAHAAFDPLWQRWKALTGLPRSKAYAWLAQQLGIPHKDCHIGMFDVDQCERVVQVCLEQGESS